MLQSIKLSLMFSAFYIDYTEKLSGRVPDIVKTNDSLKEGYKLYIEEQVCTHTTYLLFLIRKYFLLPWHYNYNNLSWEPFSQMFSILMKNAK